VPKSAKSSSRRRRIVFNVLDSSWSGAGEEFAGGEHTRDNPSAELVAHASAAHHAGAIEVTEGLDKTAVQSQKQGEQAYAAAQADGSWREGHVVQVALDAIAREKSTAAAAAGHDDPDSVDVDPHAITVVLGDASPATVHVTTAGEILDEHAHIVRPDKRRRRRAT
jgi:hypothetical protein